MADTATKETLRLKRKAMASGLLQADKPTGECEDDLPAFVFGARDKDIVNKTSRKKQYLVVLPFQIHHPQEDLGRFEKLDSANPLLYLDFPEGTLKLAGTILYPSTKYFGIGIGKSKLQFGSVYDSLLVFPEYYWIGTSDENPNEDPIPFPSSMKQFEPKQE